MLVPVMAILGYGEITTTRTPVRASGRSAFHLFIYSLILLGITILASHIPVLMYIGAIFSPAGHELVIWMGLRAEKNRIPLYIKPPAGVGILDVVAGTPAAKSRLCAGDVITRVNGAEENYYFNLKTTLIMNEGYCYIQVVRNGKTLDLTYYSERGQDPGIIPVPSPEAGQFLVQKDDRIFIVFRRLWSRLSKFTLRH
jgi:hypothetical protein